MPDLGNTSVFSQTDASNNSGTMPSWSGSAAPSTLDDAGRAFQGAVTREWNWRNYTVTATGTADAKVLTYSVAPAAYYNGQRFAFIANTTNTGSATLNVNSLGAKTIKKDVSGTLTNLSASDMASGQFVEVAYNTANDCFVWVNQDTTYTPPQSLGTGDSPQFAGVNVGNASDTTITRSAAGVIAVEGGVVPKENRANTFSAAQTVNAQLIVSSGAATGMAISSNNVGVQSTLTNGFIALREGNNSSANNTLELHIRPSAGKSGYLTFTEDTVTDNWVIGTQAGSSALRFASGSVVSNTERMRIDSSGKVGIGLTPTDVTLEVAGRAWVKDATLPVLYVGNTLADYGYITYDPSTKIATVGADGTSTQLRLRTVGTERLRVTANGGVSFGSSGTAYGTSGQYLRSNGDAAPTWETPGSVLLGTLTTTSGTSVSLTSLTLTRYKFLRFVFNGVSGSSTGNISIGSFQVTTTAAAGDTWGGIADVDLGTGIGSSNLAAAGTGASSPRAGSTGYSTATTTITASIGVGNFDAGSITVYGVP